jgi:hypothetical protein
MKIIGTAFLQNSEESISYRIEFLSFTFQSLLADVNPYLVSNLELMINHVFFMSRIIFFLTLLQLFPDYLVYFLDPSNELVALSSFISSLESTSFPYIKSKVTLGKYPKHVLNDEH